MAGAVEHADLALMGLSGLRAAEMRSLRVESLTQDGGYDSLNSPARRQARRHPGARHARRPRCRRRPHEGPLLRNRAGNALSTLDARRMVDPSPPSLAAGT